MKIHVNGREHVISARDRINYASLCELAGVKPNRLPSITWAISGLRSGYILRDESAPAEEGATYGVKVINNFTC